MVVDFNVAESPVTKKTAPHRDPANAFGPLRHPGRSLPGPPGHPHTIWQLLEHLRICQDDLVEYSRDPNHVSPDFPDGYWPESDAPEDEEAWEASVAAFKNGLQEMIALVSDPTRDLFETLSWSEEGHTLLREALMLADHNAYHLGQIVQLKKALGVGQNKTWEMPELPPS